MCRRWASIETALKRTGHKPLAISAAAGTNVKDLLYQAVRLLQTTPPMPEVATIPVYRADSDPRLFTIERVPTGWRVSGEAIERAAAMTYWEYEDSIRRFQHILETLGVDKALRQAGVQEGDMVFIGEYELEWTD
jgi:GTP-binding protein